MGLLGLLSTEAGFSYMDGVPMVGFPVVGVALGLPGSTVGTAVVGADDVGGNVVG